MNLDSKLRYLKIILLMTGVFGTPVAFVALTPIDHSIEPTNQVHQNDEPITITNVFHYPANPQVNETLYVFADVTRKPEDPLVYVYYRVNGTQFSMWLGQSMSNFSYYRSDYYLGDVPYTVNTYFGQLHSHGIPGDVIEEYYIVCGSIIDDNNGTYYRAYIGADTLPPEITEVHHIPENPAPNDTVQVYANISDPSMVTEALLYYRAGGEQWNKEPMEWYRNSTYQAIIGPFSSGETIEYYITAKDGTGNNSTNGTCYKFTVSRTSSQLVSVLISPVEILAIGVVSILIQRRNKHK